MIKGATYASIKQHPFNPRAALTQEGGNTAQLLRAEFLQNDEVGKGHTTQLPTLCYS